MRTAGIQPLILAAMTVVLCSSQERIIVEPQDTGVALVNPRTGWQLHHYDNNLRVYGLRLEPFDENSQGCLLLASRERDQREAPR
jgi:hypothetical protein